MPKNLNDGLNNRMDKLETKLDHNIEATRRTDRVLASLEPKIDVHTQELRKFDRHLDSIRTLVEDRTSATRTVTWVQLGALLFVLLLPVGGAVGSLFYTYVLPQRVENIVLASNVVNSKFAGVIDEKLKPINESLKAIDDKLQKLDENMSSVNRAVKHTVTRQRLLPLIRRQVSAPRKELNKTLPEARELFTVVRQMDVSLTRQDYMELSRHLLDNYASASEPLKAQIAETLLEAAKARSVTEKDGTSTASITAARQAGNLVEGTVDLSSRSTWKDAVFLNCTISMSKPEIPILLDGVQFINCDFQGNFNESAHRVLLTAILQSNQSTVNATIEPKGEVQGYALSPPKARRSERGATR